VPKLLKSLQPVVVVVAGVTAPCAGVLADSAATLFVVSAQVVPRIQLLSEAERRSLSISPADLARGELELELAYRVVSNDPRGFVLEVAPRLGLAELVEVRIEDTRAELTDLPLEFLQRERGVRELRVRYRVRLREGLRPGEYPLPWRLSARPI
jgi:hypothetical protein